MLYGRENEGPTVRNEWVWPGKGSSKAEKWLAMRVRGRTQVLLLIGWIPTLVKIKHRPLFPYSCGNLTQSLVLGTKHVEWVVQHLKLDRNVGLSYSTVALERGPDPARDKDKWGLSTNRGV
jgi:hypothetical protein